MTLRRFQLIERFFQINSASYDKNQSLEKVLPLLKMFEGFNDVYQPTSRICIDEIVAPFVGRFSYIVYNPMKPDKWGIKIFGVADAITGYCLNLIPYMGAETYKFFKVGSLNGLVADSMKKYGCEGASLYIDNYYCNFTLAEILLSLGFNVTGTFRQNRKDVPKIYKEAVVKKKVIAKQAVQPTNKKKANEIKETKDTRYFSSELGIYAIKWRSKREVSMLTTNHPLGFEERESARNRPSDRPAVIHEYNQYMRGIDRLNQRTHYIK